MTTELGAKEDDQPTFPCRTCGRRFIRSSLDKHEPACRKLTKMQRKIFDSGKQRSLGTDIPLKDVRKAAIEREKIGGIFPRPQTNWREKHEEFMEVVNASKQVGKALKTGGPLPPPPKTAINSDYVRCEFCGRTFNKNAAERHIEFCKEQNMRKAPLAAKGGGQQRQLKQQTAAGNRPTSQSRQKTGASSTSSSRVSASSANRNGNISAASTKPMTTSSSRSGRPGSAGPRRPDSGAMAHQQGGGGMIQIGGAAIGGGMQGMHIGGQQQPHGSKLPQPTSKRSNSAPRGGDPLAQTTQRQQTGGGGGSKSSFATPKSAGHAQSAANGGGKMMAPKANSKQKMG